MKLKVFVVIPTIRDLTFLSSWNGEFRGCYGIIVEDHHHKQIETPIKYFKRIWHYTWKDIDHDFGTDNWIFSRKNAGIRSYGFYKAYQLEADVVITLDDDCYPVESNFVSKHLENLKFKAANDWFATYPDPEFMYTHGFPYAVRNNLRIVISHGLWSGAFDLDAKTEVKLPRILSEKPYPQIRQIIPNNYFFPMCSMNLAYKREITPLMFFPMMGYDPKGKHWGYDRYDDIWAGLFAKKVCDHLNLTVVNGSPFIEHRKKSDPTDNLAKELPGMKINEALWRQIHLVKLSSSTVLETFAELITEIKLPKTSYFTSLKEAINIWLKLFTSG